MVNIRNLSFGYGQRPVLNNLNLELPAGNIYGLLGKNGAGKSTLLKLIAGLLFPKNGSIEVSGWQPRDRHPQFLRDIYLVTEEFDLPSVSMENYLSIYSPFYPKFSRQVFETCITEFQLPRSGKINRMSYGQKKKFLLSFGIATGCKLLILDEPTNGLDIPAKSQFRKLMAGAINEERSFIISTHQVRDMENLIDPIIILDQGQVMFYEDFGQVAAKLTIERQKHAPEQANVIWYESFPGGYTVVRENTGNEETRINLEVLFNAVINNPEKVKELFENKIYEADKLF